MPEIDWDGTTSKSLDELVRPVRKFVKSVTETSSKMRELFSYNKVVNNLIYESRWRQAINENLWNLNLY